MPVPRNAGVDASLAGAFDGDGKAPGLAVDIGDGQGPERDQVDARDELGRKGGQELPVPAQEIDEKAANAEVESVFGRRAGTFNKKRNDGELQRIRKKGDHESDADAEALRKVGRTESHRMPACYRLQSTGYT